MWNHTLVRATTLLLLATAALPTTAAFVCHSPRHLAGSNDMQRLHIRTTTVMEAVLSLKNAATPLLDSGKNVAQSGEMLISLTSILGLYGGNLSAAGANLRNGGDHIAQAAASCRFKTASELVSNEFRDGADCLHLAHLSFRRAADDSDENGLKPILRRCAPPLQLASTCLERAGAGIMQRHSIASIGKALVECSAHLQELAIPIQRLVSPDEDDDNDTTTEGSSRALAMDMSKKITLAALQMKEGGMRLMIQTTTTT